MNATLLAYSQGKLGSFKASEREPQRIGNQLGTDKLVLLSAAAATRPAVPEGPPAPPATTVPAVTPAATAAPAETAPAARLVACTEIGNFAAAEARRFERLLAPLALGERLSQDSVSSQEITSHMVMIPPLGSKEAADKKAAELKEQGVSNYFIMNDSTPTKWAISLGVFKSEAAAQTLLAALNKQGVEGAKIAGRSTQAVKTVYRIRNIDADTRAKVDAAAARFTTVDTRGCK